MVARDDSVIRGSLIACMVFLVLSLILNFLLWRWGDVATEEAQTASSRLQTVNADVRNMQSKLDRLKAMMGVGGFTEAQIEEMKKNISDDADLALIESQFVRDMANFGPEVEAESRHYGTLPEYLLAAIRTRNTGYANLQLEIQKVRTDADADVENARKAQELERQRADDANKNLEKISQDFSEERARINLEKEETRDRLQKTAERITVVQRQAQEERSQLTRRANKLLGTIETQKKRLNTLTNDRFEVAQGRVRYVIGNGDQVTINLGSADALRKNVTFGVIDANEERLQDAKLKASLQVVRIDGPHLSLCRVVAAPETRNPIIPNDKVYSPFWSPGQRVKIALAGEIDIDDDGRPDNDAIRGQIQAAGAEVVAEVLPTGQLVGKLDASVRFLVVGEAPELSATQEVSGDDVDGLRGLGEVKSLAGELGITIIPAWKLQAYLQTIDDTLTTPLASGVRGTDFAPESQINLSRPPSDLPDLYRRSREGLQKGNRVLPP